MGRPFRFAQALGYAVDCFTHRFGKFPQHTIVVTGFKIMAHKNERELAPVICRKTRCFSSDNALKLSVP
jgi:hypothetical protein